MVAKTTKKVPANKKPKSRTRVGQVSKGKTNSLLSSKRVIFVFILVFAVIGALFIHFTNAAVDPVVDAAQSNQKAFEAIKADAASHGVAITVPATTAPKPADFGKPKVVDPTGSGSITSVGETGSTTNAAIPRPADLPPFPQLPTNPKSASNNNGSWLLPKAHADDYTRALTVNYAQQFIGWKGSWFFFYGTFPKEEWCGDFLSYVTMRAGKPYWEGAGGWRMRFTGDIASLMYRTGSLRSRDSTPVPGDVVFFNWPNTSLVNDHIGLVESVDSKGNIVTIEGNINNTDPYHAYPYKDPSYSEVNRKTWARSNPSILAYGHWW